MCRLILKSLKFNDITSRPLWVSQISFLIIHCKINWFSGFTDKIFQFHLLPIFFRETFWGLSRVILIPFLNEIILIIGWKYINGRWENKILFWSNLSELIWHIFQQKRIPSSHDPEGFSLFASSSFSEKYEQIHTGLVIW